MGYFPRANRSQEPFCDFGEQGCRIISDHGIAPCPTREEAYEAAGKCVLNHCDVLIAVWDGQGAQGVGGTSGIVAEARRKNLPITWVHAGNRKPGTEDATSLGNEQGRVSYEDLP